MSSTWWVVPFGNPRVKGHLHLTAAYRSLSRPSSPVRAQASTIRPCLLSVARTPDVARTGKTAGWRRPSYVSILSADRL